MYIFHIFLIIYTGEIRKVCGINIPAKVKMQCMNVEEILRNRFSYCIKKFISLNHKLK